MCQLNFHIIVLELQFHLPNVKFISFVKLSSVSLCWFFILSKYFSDYCFFFVFQWKNKAYLLLTIQAHNKKNKFICCICLLIGYQYDQHPIAIHKTRIYLTHFKFSV